MLPNSVLNSESCPSQMGGGSAEPLDRKVKAL